MRRIAIAVIAAIVIVIIGFFAWRTFNPGPLAFAGGSTVALADYHEANPTGVPAELARPTSSNAANISPRPPIAWSVTPRLAATEYAGGLAFPLPFGTLYSTNITADKDTGIGNYSDQDFLNAVQRGIRKDGARLYPAMPYTSYTFMTDADVLAIKAYLFSLPAVRRQNQRDTLQFPFNQRWSMTLLVMGVQSQHALCAQYRKERRVESGRLYRRSAGALRRVPHPAQSRLRARQPQEIRRRRRRRLARL